MQHKRKVIPLHRVTELEQHCTPETNNTTGSVIGDFILMYGPPYFHHVNWYRVGRTSLLLVAAFAIWQAFN